MEMTGERRIDAPRETVWQGLNDPEVLQHSIPGCESVERTGPESFQARVGVKLGPMAAKFTGKVQLTNINPPASYTIGGEGNGGAMGFAKGGADVALEELSPTTTLLKYAVKAQVGGKMAQLGARLIDSTAKQMADQFFDRFAAFVATPAEEAPAIRPSAEAVLPEGARPTPAPGTEVGDAAPDERLGAATLIGAGLVGHAGGTPPGTSTPPGTGAGTAPRPYATPRPTGAPAAISMLSLVPREIFGLPLVFWGGSLIWVLLLIVLFLRG
ncbi:MAG: Carbon monoxide dehydrogenase [Roseomonas sp.]|nr:Carbon monoxide dehydrogenase [Roseomonas sp.]